MDDTFSRRVYQVVALIPEGKVATYGFVARLVSAPRAARQVGGVLKRLPEGSLLPWYRVVNRFGKITMVSESDYARQKQHLLAEGIVFDQNEIINLQQYGWQGEIIE